MARKSPPKHVVVAGLLEQRIRNGDYLLREFPTDRQLALELDVNPRTGRKAIENLVRRGLLVRPRNGRVLVRSATSEATKRLNIALLAPAYPTPIVEQWHLRIEKAAMLRGWVARLVAYKHWDDVLINDTLGQFDGVFFIPLGGQPPDSVFHRLRHSGKVIVLDTDASRFELPSVWMASPVFVQRLLNHLHSLGHDEVDCLDTQPINSVIEARVQQWELWKAAHGKSGQFINHPVKPGNSSIIAAYDVMKSLVGEGRFTATGLFCTTGAAAIGAMRALHDCGRRIGRDVSICAADDEAGRAQYLIPSLTALGDADPRPYLSVCLDWMSRGCDGWSGPLLVQPSDVPLFLGESTGPSPGQREPSHGGNGEHAQEGNGRGEKSE